MTQANITKLATSYATVSMTIKRLEEEKSAYASKLLVTMSEDRMALPMGLLEKVSRTSWTYTKRIKSLEEAIREAKDKEVATGKARASSKAYIRFTGIEKESA